ncbi:MAG: hypothetical protein ABMA64_09415 [Myxococcota bacterium]
MPPTEVRVIVLVEDDAQRQFVTQLIQHLGLRRQRIVPCGDSTRVLQTFRLEVEVLRRKRKQQNLGLIVVIDADDASTEPRRRELDHIVEEVLGQRRSLLDRIVYLVPARAIETWYVHFCDPNARPVDPAVDYKETPSFRLLGDDLRSAARDAVVKWADPHLDAPESVVQARVELTRVR